jgi:hypothetical protein
MLAKLTRIAEEFNVAIYITNQMTSDPGATLSLVSDPKKPVGGNILAHASATRVYLRKGISFVMKEEASSGLQRFGIHQMFQKQRLFIRLLEEVLMMLQTKKIFCDLDKFFQRGSNYPHVPFLQAKTKFCSFALKM